MYRHIARYRLPNRNELSDALYALGHPRSSDLEYRVDILLFSGGYVKDIVFR